MRENSRLNDELYTFLLETRAEQEMQKASNRADSEVIDPADARFSTHYFTKSDENLILSDCLQVLQSAFSDNIFEFTV